MITRSSGVLLHVTSLPGPYGIGDLGPSARAFIDWLAETRSRYWQILPLGPLGFGNSPYSSPSSHAGNVDLLSPDDLANRGLIGQPRPVSRSGRVDYEAVRHHKRALVEEARSSRISSESNAFADFRETERDWLAPYALFMALKEAHGGGAWVGWDDDLRLRRASALEEARRELADEISSFEFGQYLFSTQMEDLRRHARDRGVAIVGDLPFYAATDSVDIWSRPDLFSVDPATGSLVEVAGVPADPLSPVGQEWGMPTYRWEAHHADGFDWWLGRIAALQRQVDVLRLDHFTGFYRYYAIPADTVDPGQGDWRKGPGTPFFETVRAQLGDVPMIAEDLGPLLPEVDAFRRRLGIPGIRVLLEAFGANVDESRRPDNFPIDCVVYTGTHDYDTASGRIESADSSYRDRALEFTGGATTTFAADLVERAWVSPQVLAVAPLQDLLELGSDSRMNTPGTVGHNWEWRLSDLTRLDTVTATLVDLNDRAGRRSRGTADASRIELDAVQGAEEVDDGC